jgi:hypothetical protein
VGRSQVSDPRALDRCPHLKKNSRKSRLEFFNATKSVGKILFYFRVVSILVSVSRPSVRTRRPALTPSVSDRRVLSASTPGVPLADSESRAGPAGGELYQWLVVPVVSLARFKVVRCGRQWGHGRRAAAPGGRAATR